MNKKELKILGISHSNTQEGSYVLVLSQKIGMAKLPVIIKISDAQRIAMDIEGIKNTRPTTHDLIKSITDAYMLDIQEVFIYSVLEGIFYTKIILNNGIEEIEIESSIGDAVILSLIYDCPIFASSDVMSSAGVLINDDGSPINDDSEPIQETSKEERIISVEDLEKMLEHAIKQEEFEIAATIRDRIDEIKSKI